MADDHEPPFDVVVVGAGPAGLTAALYLARYRRRVMVLHDGASRALRIPRTYNVPGFPDGVGGPELIDGMMAHALRYGARVERQEVTRAARAGDGFELTGDGGRWRSRALVLATGVLLHEVDLPAELHEAAISAGVLRYCPICDGFEAIDKSIGVIGCDANGAAEALFLRQYSRDVTLMPLSHSELTAEQVAELDEAKIRVVQGALRGIAPRPDHIEVSLDGGDRPLSFGVIYPALGSSPRNSLARGLGAQVNDAGCFPPTAAVETSVAGLFAAGDVLEGLDQISVAMGQGAIAATSAHNWLREQDRHTLQARD